MCPSEVIATIRNRKVSRVRLRTPFRPFDVCDAQPLIAYRHLANKDGMWRADVTEKSGEDFRKLPGGSATRSAGSVH